MNKTYLVFPGNLSQNDLVKTSKLQNKKIIFITEQVIQKNRASKCLKENQFYHCDDITKDQNYNNYKIELPDIKKIDFLIKELFKDISFVWLAERTHIKPELKSNFLFSNDLISIIKNLIFFFKFINPDRLIFGTTPHKVETYILYKIASIYKRPILFGNPIAILRKSIPTIDINRHIILGRKKSNLRSDNEAKKIIKLFENDKSVLEEYEFINKNILKKKSISYKVEFKNFSKFNNLKKLYTFYSVYKKYLAFSYYKKITKDFILPNKYIVFFLQYQPERTSTPDAGIFSAQIYCINLISMVLNYFKSDIKIVVKEHNSQFLSKWNTFFRDKNFYREISKLNNVIMAPLEISSLKLIDQSVCVATLNGTAIFEAAAKGKPTIAFGPKSRIFKWSNCFSIQNFDDINKALKKILNNKNINKNLIIKSFEKYLSNCIANGFDLTNMNISFNLVKYMINLKL